jgi:hypothetical protein
MSTGSLGCRKLDVSRKDEHAGSIDRETTTRPIQEDIQFAGIVSVLGGRSHCRTRMQSETVGGISWTSLTHCRTSKRMYRHSPVSAEAAPSVRNKHAVGDRAAPEQTRVHAHPASRWAKV